MAVTICLSALATPTQAGVIFGLTGNTLGGGSRWDAAPRVVDFGGGVQWERSLDGSLRYALQGGSYQAYRDLFTWTALPSVADFQAAIEAAFSAWTVPDPVTGLTTQVRFAYDPGTAVVGTGPAGTSTGNVDPRGAEIDLFGSTDAQLWNPGDNGTQGETFFSAVTQNVTLTSGVANYPNSFAISGADITVNSNPGAVYSLDFFRRLLTHEIGHAIGLGDIEGDLNPGAFIDDNLDLTNSGSALATLTNPWALQVDPLNPAASPLARYTVPFADPGTTTSNVDILMESRNLGIGPTNPIGNLTPLTNDDYGTRQFLYPSLERVQAVPEPVSLLVWAVVGGLAVVVRARQRPRRQPPHC